MRRSRLTDMTGGWIVGDFEPSVLRSSACEVACKHYQAGAVEGAHVHRVATEVTLVVRGHVRMGALTLVDGDIVVLDPGEATDFEALTDATTLVVKMPSVHGDKYPAPAVLPPFRDGGRE